MTQTHDYFDYLNLSAHVICWSTFLVLLCKSSPQIVVEEAGLVLVINTFS